ncbi:MAG: hypothetical protein WA624_03555 [Methylocella sp.]
MSGFPAIIGRLIPRLASPFDPEVVATARAIERALATDKLDWHDMAKAVCGAAPRTPHGRDETPDARELRAWLEAISGQPWLSAWAAEFVIDLLARDNLGRLSEKQLACVRRIIRQARARGVRP